LLTTGSVTEAGSSGHNLSANNPLNGVRQ